MLLLAQNAKLSEEQHTNELSFSTMTAGKLCLLRLAQEEAFSEDISHLQLGKSVLKGSCLARLPQVFLEDRLLRIKGCLMKADMTEEEIYPIITPKGHLTLLVCHQHKLLKHAGIEAMLTALRGEYWIISAS